MCRKYLSRVVKAPTKGMDVFRPANPTLSRYKDNKQGVAQGRARDRSVIVFPIEQRESRSAVPFIVEGLSMFVYL